MEVWIPAQKAVGQKFMFDWQGKSYPFKMMDVVKDFHFSGFDQVIQLYGFMLNNRPEFNYIIVQVRPTGMADVLNFLEEKWTSLRPDEPFELGASVANIVLLLSQDFLLLVLIAILIASPLAWWSMHQWLQTLLTRLLFRSSYLSSLAVWHSSSRF